MYTYKLYYAGWINGSGWSYTDNLYEEGEAKTPIELWDEDEFKDWVKENAKACPPRENEDVRWKYKVYKDGELIYSFSAWEKGD